VGFDVRGRGAAYTVKIRRTGSIRAVDAYLDALRTLGYPAADTRTRLPVHEEDAVWATDWLLDRGLAHHWPLIGLNPGASWPAKRWGTAHFAGLGDRLIRERQARILLIQGPGQEQYIQDVCAAMHTQPVVVDLLPLPRLAALIQRCHVFVSNDCGPMHIAAAVGTRTVGLFGPSRPDIWFPYPAEDGHTALSPPTTDCCGQDVCTRAEPCITGISIDRVMEAIDRALYVIGDSRKNG
jgi:ADP-heptose:LPS heptosyltransferase